jgi:hypothetical protein
MTNYQTIPLDSVDPNPEEWRPLLRKAEADKPEEEPMRDVHTYFGLSYANYLVINRTVLQSMPLDWQDKLVKLLDQLEAAFGGVDVEYHVETGQWVYANECTGDQLKLAGVTRHLPEDNDPNGEVVYYDRTGQEIPYGGRVFVPGPDPIPHYNRGRTIIEPRLPKSA